MFGTDLGTSALASGLPTVSIAGIPCDPLVVNSSHIECQNWTVTGVREFGTNAIVLSVGG